MPEWEYTFWSDKALRTLAEQGFPHVLEVWDLLIGIQRADIGRYMVLATHGGLYMDTDVDVSKDLEPALLRYRSTKTNRFAADGDGPLYFAPCIATMPSAASIRSYLGWISETTDVELDRLDHESRKVTNYIIYCGSRGHPFLHELIRRSVYECKTNALLAGVLPRYIFVPHTTGAVLVTRLLLADMKRRRIGEKDLHHSCFSRHDVQDVRSLSRMYDHVSAFHMGNTVRQDERQSWNMSQFNAVFVNTEAYLRDLVHMDQAIAQAPFLTITALLVMIVLVVVLIRY